MKRIFDIVFSSVSLLLLSPLYVGIALAIKFTCGGSVIFRQQREGKGRKPFILYKFRTMCENAESEGPALAVPCDPRVTPVGRYLRRFHLDELPQFWNILKGDMSVVGPRPERKVFSDQIVGKFPDYGEVYEMRPGITSLGVLEYGYASNIAQMIERATYDIDYIRRKSFKLDLRIMLITVKRILQGKGI